MMVGERFFNVLANCVDRISTSFRIPNLSDVVAAFSGKGYELANGELKNIRDGLVIDMSIILGNDFGHVLPMKSVKFDNNKDTCIYINTPSGIVFSVNSNQIMSNMDKLPDNRDSKHYTKDTVSFIDSNSSSLVSEPIALKQSIGSIQIDEVHVTISPEIALQRYEPCNVNIQNTRIVLQGESWSLTTLSFAKLEED